ncbi:putative UPF0481 protein [Iris pallida]|uniref:UPF0481 protein n=1 Tax=Iris pallida TaxID=29817 RepID=A0AAX6GKN2_IRIPA|nr:putative UPF0481 protein [Iris pallida]
MAPSKPSSSDPSAPSPSPFGESEWVIHIRNSLEEEIEEEDIKTPVSIFCVPEALVSGKPEAYRPQLFALGPYHHWQPKLYDMQRHKIASARRTKSRLQGPKLEELAQLFMKREHKIRGYYHRHINHSKETIAWMMVVDACFLLEFLQNYTENNREMIRKKLTSTPSRRVETERMKMGYNMVLRDVVMLENQIPLYVLRKLMNFLCPSTESADSELSQMLSGFAKEVCPFKTMDADQSGVDDIVGHAHLLELVYHTIVPNQKLELVEEATAKDIDVDEEEEDDHEVEPKGVEFGDTSYVRSAYNWFKNMTPSLDGPLIGSVKRAVVSGPVRLLVKFPWKVVSALPVLSIAKKPVEGYFASLMKEKSEHGDQSSHIDRPPLVEEIAIPSVADLFNSGVSFRPTAGGDVTGIAFDAKTATMRLPVVTLDVNTEVVLRNLVAYEASVVAGPLVFTRYTELMNGIVDTEEDVRMLRKRGVVVNRMKSDGEAAALWNGMSKSVRLTKVGFLDTVIRDVNKYYRSRWRVKAKGFMKKYVFGSWQVLTFLAAALLLFLTCVQAFCSVYSCNSHLTKISSVRA